MIVVVVVVDVRVVVLTTWAASTSCFIRESRDNAQHGPSHVPST